MNVFFEESVLAVSKRQGYARSSRKAKRRFKKGVGHFE